MEGHRYSQTLCLWVQMSFLYHMIRVSKGGFKFLDCAICHPLSCEPPFDTRIIMGNFNKMHILYAE